MLIFGLFFVLSALLLILFIMIALKKKADIHTIMTPYRIIMLGLFVSAFLFFVPYYVAFFQEEQLVELCTKTVLLSAHHAIRLFVVGAEYSEIYAYAMEKGTIGAAYSLYGSLLYVASPLMTFGFILSFFRGITTKMRIFFSRQRKVDMFSQLNAQSIFFARQLLLHNPKALVIFTGVPQEEDDNGSELCLLANRMGAVLRKEDIATAEAQLPRGIRNARCFIFGDDEELNVSHAFDLLKSTCTRDKQIYVQCNQENYLFEEFPAPSHIVLFRIEHVRSLVLRTLTDIGARLFETATPASRGKCINALVLGLGRYGTEMAKGLSWVTQAEGYTTRINCMDRDPFVRERFKHQCPGFFSDDTAAEDCDIQFYITEVGTWTADCFIQQLPDINYVFVALGDDDMNIRTAYEVRSLLARMDCFPIIQAIVQNSDKKRLLQGRQTARGREYDISFIGSMDELYSYDAIVRQDEMEAVARENARWVPENKELILYHSTQYSAYHAQLIHRYIMDQIGLPEELRPRSEHRRWTNYMYSEGYQRMLFDPGTTRPKVNDLAKVHPMLCPFEELPDHMKTIY